MKHKIKVTQRHIDTGKAVNEFYCPIALAMRDVGLVQAEVGDTHAFYGYGLHRCEMPLPKEARDFIREFDNDRRAALPFEFEAESISCYASKDERNAN